MVDIKISIVGASSTVYSPQGVKTDGLPKPFMTHILRGKVAPVEVELGAYTSGSRQRLLKPVMRDPWMMSEEQARKLLEDVLALPYHDSMRQDYK